MIRRLSRRTGSISSATHPRFRPKVEAKLPLARSLDSAKASISALARTRSWGLLELLPGRRRIGTAIDLVCGDALEASLTNVTRFRRPQPGATASG